MGLGFDDSLGLERVVGWELDEVAINKYHVTFWFEAEDSTGLLNVADRFSYRSTDGQTSYDYEVYGQPKRLDVDRLLRVRVEEIIIVSRRRLDLHFEDGDVLSIHDNPEFRWWFYLFGPADCRGVRMRGTRMWSVEDDNPN